MMMGSTTRIPFGGFARKVRSGDRGRYDVVGRRWACLEDGVEQPLGYYSEQEFGGL